MDESESEEEKIEIIESGDCHGAEEELRMK
jgi:hypothetical protein